MRIGIVGAGLIGGKRAEAATGHSIVAVTDTRRDRAEALAERFVADTRLKVQAAEAPTPA